MRPLGTYRAAPSLPPNLAALGSLARDLRWSWRHQLRGLFEELDAPVWERSDGNPVEFLRLVEPAVLQAFSLNEDYVARLHAATERLAEEDASGGRSAAASTLIAGGIRVAYFCAEFGITESLPIYSGGLGVLAGDHLKSSSDLGVPLVGVGLFYREGFFRQLLTGDSRQLEAYPIVDPYDLPLDLLETPSGVPPIVTVQIADRDVHLLVRRARVGRVPLLLLDSHLPVNRPADREITSRLYGGDIEMRIQQEMVLGIGGLRALDLAGLRPSVRHANEGHATFLGIEKIRQLRVENGLSFEEAREVATAGNVFTTHTPVPAGIDLFSPQLIKKYFEGMLESLGISVEKFLGLGRQVPDDAREPFSMAVLGLRLSSRLNGVSRLHAAVSRRMWSGLFPEAPLSEMPIEAVTNGVHAPTWTAPSIAALDIAGSPDTVDRGEFLRLHEELRASLVGGVRARTAAGLKRRGAPDSEVADAWSLLHPGTLTIGFARRFATYKRATLIFHDPARLARILAHPTCPVQLVFAGKAHPKDEPGKGFMKQIGEFANEPEFHNRVVLLEGYDLRLARLLVAGSDVWLNNPRRPHEASGTSGMKAAMNGGLNLSVLDGWWDEAPREATGFTFSDETVGRGDEEVAAALYETLEKQVVPLFYDNRAGWVEKMIAAASTLARLFSTDRMVDEYIQRCYIPAAERVNRLSTGDFKKARDLAAWKARITERWNDVGFISVQLSEPDPARLPVAEPFDVKVQIRLGSLSTDEVVVDWYEGTIDHDGVVDTGFSTPLTLTENTDGRASYAGTITRPSDDTRGYSVRLRPYHAELVHPNEMGLVLWAG